MGDHVVYFYHDSGRASKHIASGHGSHAVFDGLCGDMDRRCGSDLDLGRGRRPRRFQGAERRPARWSARPTPAGVEAPPPRWEVSGEKRANLPLVRTLAFSQAVSHFYSHLVCYFLRMILKYKYEKK